MAFKHATRVAETLRPGGERGVARAIRRVLAVLRLLRRLRARVEEHLQVAARTLAQKVEFRHRRPSLGAHHGKDLVHIRALVHVTQSITRVLYVFPSSTGLGFGV